MNRFLAGAGMAVLALASLGSATAADLYGAIGYAHLDQDLRDTQLGAIQGRFGARFTPYVGIEREAAIGVSDDDFELIYLPYRSHVKTDLSYQIAAYAVGYLPVSPKAELFARLGYGRTELDQDWTAGDQQGSTTADWDSWNYGVGGQYFFDGRNGVRLDYTRHDASGDNNDIDAWAIGYTRRF
jgi:hypothetical protein